MSTAAPTSEPASLTEPERARIQRRVLWALTSGQIVGGAALASSVTVGALVVTELLGANTPWAGISVATTTTGTAFASQVLSRKMRRMGRRPGLQLGYSLAMVGAFVAAIGAEARLLPLFLVGLFVFGNGQASNLLARYAAADLALPDERSRAMGRIVFAQTFGAVGGPLLIGPAEFAGQEWLGLWKYTGPWLVGGAFFGLAALNTTLRLRPDPLVLAGGVSPAGAKMKLPSVWASLQLIGRSPKARLALLAMVVAQFVMVAEMAMTPVHMKLHGWEDLSQYVVSAHVAGMFAFAPLVGRFADKRGRVQSIMVGAALLIGAGMIAALSAHQHLLLFPSMWLLGVGWNFGMLGGSSLLTESIPLAERVSVQGSADLIMSFCGGAAGLSAGVIRQAVGYHMLANLGDAAAAVLLVAAFWYLRVVSRRPAELAEVAVTG
ncbi:MAG: MFS transporter [Acidimicrobiia bacterium]|nr:MFS transporter [Acidimicrobiia bacterium]